VVHENILVNTVVAHKRQRKWGQAGINNRKKQQRRRKREKKKVQTKPGRSGEQKSRGDVTREAREKGPGKRAGKKTNVNEKKESTTGPARD